MAVTSLLLDATSSQNKQLQALTSTMKTFQIVSLFALMAQAMAFAPQLNQGELSSWRDS